MPKYWGKQIFTHGRFLEVGEKQKTERERERKKNERMVSLLKPLFNSIKLKVTKLL